MRWWAVLVLLALAGCSTHHDATPTTTTRPENVVAQGAAAFRSIAVSANGRTVTLTHDRAADVAPLLAGRVFDHPDTLATYGLDRPPARLQYTRPDSTVLVLLVGNANFDRHGVYVKRQGEPTVYLTPADQLRPVLALVGIDIAPPSD